MPRSRRFAPVPSDPVDPAAPPTGVPQERSLSHLDVPAETTPTDPQSGLRGLLGYIPVDGLARGRHVLAVQLQTVALGETRRNHAPLRADTIPFRLSVREIPPFPESRAPVRV